MNEKLQAELASANNLSQSRRGFLRTVAGGALALSAGQLLAGCGGGGGGIGFSPQTNVPYTVFLSSFLAKSVLRYNSSTGKLEEFWKPTLPDPSDTAGLALEDKFPQTTAGLVVSPDKKNLFVFSPGSNKIFMVDIASGTLIRTITSPITVNTTHDGVIGPDGMLYYVNAPSLTAQAGSSKPDSIEILDPATGDHVGTYINSNTSPEVRGPFGLNFAPNGDLFVSSVLSFGFNPKTFPFRPDKISHFDAATKAFKGFAATAQHLSFTLAFLPNGQLIAPSFFFNRIYEYNPGNGQLVDSFADVQFPLQVVYGPDGDLYVTSFGDQGHVDLLTDNSKLNDDAAQGSGRMLRLDGKTGSLRSVVLEKLPYGAFLAFL